MADSEYPERQPRDHVRALADAAINAVPVVGGAGSALLAFYLPASLGRRREAWARLLDERLAEVEHVLLDDEALLTIVLEATKAALGTHLEEKLHLLAGCVVSAATGRTADSFLAMRYLGHVEALEPEHFRLLGFLASAQLMVPDVSFAPDYSGVEGVGVPAGAMDPCVRDLAGRGLAVSHDPNAHAGIRAPGGTWAIGITSEGRELVRFVRIMDDTPSDG